MILKQHCWSTKIYEAKGKWKPAVEQQLSCDKMIWLCEWRCLTKAPWAVEWRLYCKQAKRSSSDNKNQWGTARAVNPAQAGNAQVSGRDCALSCYKYASSVLASYLKTISDLWL